MGNTSHEALLKEMDNWPTYYPNGDVQRAGGGGDVAPLRCFAGDGFAFTRLAIRFSGRVSAAPLDTLASLFTRIPRNIISQAAMMAAIIMINNDQCGRWVRMSPVIIGFAAAPSQPSAWAEK